MNYQSKSWKRGNRLYFEIKGSNFRAHSYWYRTGTEYKFKTKHPKLVTAIAGPNISVMYDSLISPENVDLFSYVNSKIYVKRHGRTQIQNLYRDILVPLRDRFLKISYLLPFGKLPEITIEEAKENTVGSPSCTSNF